MSRPCHYTFTRFHEAIRKGSMDDVELGMYILGRQAIQLTQICGRTSVEYACMYGHIDILDRTLLYVYRDKPKLESQTANELFDLACKFNQDMVARHLVQRHGAVPSVTETDVYELAKKGHFKCLSIAFECKELLSNDLVDLVLRTVVTEGCSFRFYELGPKFLDHAAVAKWMQVIHPFLRILFRNEEGQQEAAKALVGLQLPADAIIGGFEEHSIALLEVAVKLNSVNALDFMLKRVAVTRAKADIVERCADLACGGGLLDLIPYLVEQGLNTNYSARWHTRLVNALIAGKAPMVIHILKRFKQDMSDLDAELRLSSLIRLIFEENDGVSLEELLSWGETIWLSTVNNLRDIEEKPRKKQQASSDDAMKKLQIENPYLKISKEVVRVGKNYRRDLSMDVLQTLLKFGLSDVCEKEERAENIDEDILSRYVKIVGSDVPKSMAFSSSCNIPGVVASRHVWRSDLKVRLKNRDFINLPLNRSTVCLLDYLPRNKPCVFPFFNRCSLNRDDEFATLIEASVLFRSLEYLDGCSIHWNWQRRSHTACLSGEPLLALFAKWIEYHEIKILSYRAADEWEEGYRSHRLGWPKTMGPNSPENLPPGPKLYDDKTSLKYLARKAIRTAVWSSDLPIGNSEKFALLNYSLPSALVDYVFPRSSTEDIHKIESACAESGSHGVIVYLPV